MTSIVDKQIETAEKEWLDLWKKGPTRLRWDKVPLQVGDSAPDFELQDTSGNSVHLRRVGPFFQRSNHSFSAVSICLSTIDVIIPSFLWTYQFFQAFKLIIFNLNQVYITTNTIFIQTLN